MKKTLQIAKLELSLLFYSPIAWLLTIVLFVQVSLTFTFPIEGYQHIQEIWPHLAFLTTEIFTRPFSGIFSSLLGSLYLYMPLITMGIISRETSSGTIKLLYASPLTIRQIIFGKYIAMLVYNLILIGALGLVCIGGGLSILHFDYPNILSALLGIYLLLCAYAAIGLFMSSLTVYQVVAAICTFVVFACLNYIGALWQDKAFVRDLTYCLGMPGRTEKFIAGLLTTRDIIYFLVIVFIFLALAISKLWLSRESKSMSYRVVQYTVIVLIGLTIGYLSSRPRYIGYYDTTDTQVNTLRQNTQDILQQLGDAPVEITEYINFFERGYGYAAPSARNADIERWEPYLRFKPNIHLHWVYFYDSIPDPGFYKVNPNKTLEQILEKNAKFLDVDPDDFMPPEAMHRTMDLRGEDNRLTMVVQYKDKNTLLRTFSDAQFWPGETEIAAAFKRLLTERPKVLFVNDGYERSIEKLGDRDYEMLTNYKPFRYALLNQGFDVDTLSLKTQDIPEGLAALVIADAKVDYDTATLGKIKRYIDNGGNLLIAGEPDRAPITNRILRLLGVQLLNGTLVEQSKDLAFNLVAPQMTPTCASLSAALKYSRDDSVPVSMPGVSPLAYDSAGSFKVQPLLVSDPRQSWNRTGKLVLDSGQLVFSPSAGDVAGSFPTALALTRSTHGKEQRIVVTGDADFLSNAELNRTNVKTANFQFANALFGWFAYNNFPIETTRPKSRDNTITLTATGAKVIKYTYLGVIPGIFILLGTIMLVRRKRK
ncbi:ABC-2 type transport system permease protein [Chitinophaga costaii]|uniref:ABC-2 type transport system permease protein n=1 Tax=Chitinophaga costaii TaxID=1335309 RepID=A0A1C4EPD6_9BACT|nr:Gldg family protein [Chitinophaga costaii]PUZ22492.1 ABC transporter permease [Chitinophaga costaii]SCC45458.1 ABC-2 type transport system permease protein [Chitinophaga costaii]